MATRWDSVNRRFVGHARGDSPQVALANFGDWKRYTRNLVPPVAVVLHESPCKPSTYEIYVEYAEDQRRLNTFEVIEPSALIGA